MGTASAIDVEVVLDHIKAYVDRTWSMAKKLEEVIRLADSLSFDRMRVVLSDIIRLDTEADNYRREIVEKDLPTIADAIIRENIRTLIRMIDHVGEWIKDGLRHLDLIPIMGIPADVRGYITYLLRLVRNGVEAIRDSIDMLKTAKYSEAYRYGGKLEEIEEEADRVLHEAKKKIVEISNKVDNIAYIVFLNDLLKALETATDYEEDAGDIIKSLSLSLAKLAKTK